jgi:hypothetical protein
VRDKLVSVQSEDFLDDDDDVLSDKAGRFYSVFETLESLQNLKITDTRKDNLAIKRQGKRTQSFVDLPPLTSSVTPVRTGPPAPPQTDEEAQRVTSISDLSESSAGYRLFHACQEIESQNLANLFCTATLRALFGKRPQLGWATGRDRNPVVQWRSR